MQLSIYSQDLFCALLKLKSFLKCLCLVFSLQIQPSFLALHVLLLLLLLLTSFLAPTSSATKSKE